MITSISVARYICESMGCSLDEMTAHFSIRNALIRKSSTLQEKLDALSELSRMPSWSNVDCLPVVLLLIRKAPSQLADAAQITVIGPLLEKLSAPHRQGFHDTIKRFGSSDLTTALQDLNQSTRFAAKETRRNVEELGLFSIDHNIDITIALAILAVLAMEDPAQTREFLDQPTIQGGAWNNVAEILDRALSLAFGRHQCLLAVDCLLSLGELRRADAALRGLCSQDGDKQQILSEPDRLFRHCRMAQLVSGSETVAWAREELTVYSALRRLPGSPLAVATHTIRLRALAVWQEAVLQIVLTKARLALSCGYRGNAWSAIST